MQKVRCAETKRNQDLHIFPLIRNIHVIEELEVRMPSILLQIIYEYGNEYIDHNNEQLDYPCSTIVEQTAQFNDIELFYKYVTKKSKSATSVVCNIINIEDQDDFELMYYGEIAAEDDHVFIRSRYMDCSKYWNKFVKKQRHILQSFITDIGSLEISKLSTLLKNCVKIHCDRNRALLFISTEDLGLYVTIIRKNNEIKTYNMNYKKKEYSNYMLNVCNGFIYITNINLYSSYVNNKKNIYIYDENNTQDCINGIFDGYLSYIRKVKLNNIFKYYSESKINDSNMLPDDSCIRGITGHNKKIYVCVTNKHKNTIDNEDCNYRIFVLDENDNVCMNIKLFNGDPEIDRCYYGSTVQDICIKKKNESNNVLSVLCGHMVDMYIKEFE